MSWHWPSEFTLAALFVAWAVVWWLRRRNLNFSVLALIALALGVPIGLLAPHHWQALKSCSPPSCR
jgi:uncharacterized protein